VTGGHEPTGPAADALCAACTAEAEAPVPVADCPTCLAEVARLNQAVDPPHPAAGLRERGAA